MNERLELLRNQIAAIDVSQPEHWQKFEELITTLRPLIRAGFPEHWNDFVDASATPHWEVAPIHLGPRLPDDIREREQQERHAENQRIALAARRRLIAYLDGLLHLPPHNLIRELRGETMVEQDDKAVFVIHGRNEALRRSMFEFLRAAGLNPLEWSEAIRLTGSGSPEISKILDAAFAHARAIIALLTPDDMAHLKEEFWGPEEKQHERELTGQPRQNVLFELGLALGRCESRTIVVQIGDLRPISDTAGRHALRLNNSAEQRQALLSRLDGCGCKVNFNRTDWMKTGNFELAKTSP